MADGMKRWEELAKTASNKDFTHILRISQEQHQRQHGQRIIDETRQRAMAEIDIRGNCLKDPKTCLSYFKVDQRICGADDMFASICLNC